MPKPIKFEWLAGHTPVFQVQVTREYGTVSVEAMVWQHNADTQQLQGPPSALEKFMVCAYEYKGSDEPTNKPGRLTSWRCEYRQPYSVGTENAREMLATLTALDKNMQAYHAELGAANSFGQYLIRVARSLGIAKFCGPKGKYDYNLLDITWVDGHVVDRHQAHYIEA